MTYLYAVQTSVSRSAEQPWHYRVLPMSHARSNLPRLLHGLGTNPLPRYLYRLTSVGLEITLSSILDRLAPLRAAPLEVEPGSQLPQSAAFALYLHWSPDGRISPLVRRQISLWQQCGFGVVFLSNTSPPKRDWDAISADTVLRVRRSNIGRDFGAWRDGLRLVNERFGPPQEVLLANDSVLGPFLPLHPLIDAWRAGGDGLFGLTESFAGTPHLQSYALLVRGTGPIATLAAHLADLPNSRSKWRLVQRGEIALSHRMRVEGHFCGALFDYPTLCGLVNEESRRALGPRFNRPEALLHYPLNPTIHLWQQLITSAGFPFLKRELFRRMPDTYSPNAPWRALLPPGEAVLIEEHMRMMGTL